MTWQDAVLLLELLFIVGIYRDDHAMRRLTEEAVRLSRESLNAQLAYLALRRRWYELRTKPKAKEEKTPETKDDAKTQGSDLAPRAVGELVA